MANDIMLYGLSTCIHCRHAKEFLDECGSPYDLVYVDKTEGEERARVVEEVKKHNPSLSFPTILIGDAVVVGFKKDEMQKALGDLS